MAFNNIGHKKLQLYYVNSQMIPYSLRSIDGALIINKDEEDINNLTISGEHIASGYGVKTKEDYYNVCYLTNSYNTILNNVSYNFSRLEKIIYCLLDYPSPHNVLVDLSITGLTDSEGRQYVVSEMCNTAALNIVIKNIGLPNINYENEVCNVNLGYSYGIKYLNVDDIQIAKDLNNTSNNDINIIYRIEPFLINNLITNIHKEVELFYKNSSYMFFPQLLKCDIREICNKAWLSPGIIEKEITAQLEALPKGSANNIYHNPNINIIPNKTSAEVGSVISDLQFTININNIGESTVDYEINKANKNNDGLGYSYGITQITINGDDIPLHYITNNSYVYNVPTFTLTDQMSFPMNMEISYNNSSYIFYDNLLEKSIYEYNIDGWLDSDSFDYEETITITPNYYYYCGLTDSKSTSPQYRVEPSSKKITIDYNPNTAYLWVIFPKNKNILNIEYQYSDDPAASIFIYYDQNESTTMDTVMEENEGYKYRYYKVKNNAETTMGKSGKFYITFR